jgi:hypothetical protein
VIAVMSVIVVMVMRVLMVAMVFDGCGCFANYQL